MSNTLQIESLKRSYEDIWPWSKSQTVLSNVDLAIKPGTITGLLGKNGSGKTTLMNCALGLLKPDSGACLTFGVNAWNAPASIRQKIGFVSQTYTSYQWMTVEQVANFWSLYYENWEKLGGLKR